MTKKRSSEILGDEYKIFFEGIQEPRWPWASNSLRSARHTWDHKDTSLQGRVWT